MRVIALLLLAGISALMPAVAQQPPTSKASVDVMGIKLGSASLLDVRGILQKVNPPLNISERKSALSGEMVGGRQVDIPNTDYVKELVGECKVREDCDRLTVGFSAPPNKGIAL